MNEVDPQNALLTAVVATAFAYEGWIIATSINAEPQRFQTQFARIALMAGTFTVMLVYILYYLGLAGAVSNQTLMAGGQEGAKLAFSTIFTSVGGTLLFVFADHFVSGHRLNGLMLGCTRGIYSIAARNQGPNPKLFQQIDSATNMPGNSAIAGLSLSSAWLVYFTGEPDPAVVWLFCFDPSELPIVTLYAFYLPIFVVLMRRERDPSAFKRFIMPFLATCGSLFMMYAACLAHGMAVVAYLIIRGVMLGGAFFGREKAA